MNARTTVSAVLLFALSISSTGCWRTVRHAAPLAPPPVLPTVSLEGDPGPGLTRVVLDVADGPAVVEEVRGGSMGGSFGAKTFGGSLEVSTRVCITPCVMDTTPGNKSLRFTLVNDEERTSMGFINADSKVSAYRHSVGLQRSTRWKGLVGWPLLVFGVLADIAIISALADGGRVGGEEIIGTGAAIGVTALGGWLVYGSVVEEQPGSGVQWHPEGVGPTARR
ncbi:MAG: hypothetical protein ACKV2T_28690 [Kofleriaceae bacterium]